MRTKEFRIIGPPGTGKTTTLSRYVRDAVKARGPDSVMICSLTRTAAAEVAGRELPIKPDAIGTLHAHAYRALGRPQLVYKFLKEWNSSHSKYRITGSRPDPNNPMDGSSGQQLGDRVLEELNKFRSRMSVLPGKVREFAKLWRDFKDSYDAIDFQDMIELAYKHIERAPGNPEVLFVDEAQDSDRSQMALLRKWARHCDRLVVVGDPNQAIYRWRGSEADAMLTPEIPKENYRVLDQSFRVPRRIHAVALRKLMMPGYDLPAFEYEPADREGQVVRETGTLKPPRRILEEATKEAEDGKTVMILATTAQLLNNPIRMMKEYGIPFCNRFRPHESRWNPLRRGTKTVSATDRVLAFLRPHSGTHGENASYWCKEDVYRWASILSSKVLIHGSKEKLKTWKDDYTATTPEELAQVILPASGFFNLDFSGSIEKETQWLLDHTLDSKRNVLRFPTKVATKRGGEVLRETRRLSQLLFRPKASGQ